MVNIGFILANSNYSDNAVLEDWPGSSFFLVFLEYHSMMCTLTFFLSKDCGANDGADGDAVIILTWMVMSGVISTVYKLSFIQLFFIYLFLAVLGFRCSDFSIVVVSGDYSACSTLIVKASPVEYGL